MSVTVIRNADWIIAYDAGAKGHVYLRHGDVAYDGDRIIHVGGAYQGDAASMIDGRGAMIMPGLVNIHSHPSSEPMTKGWNDELGSARLYGSSLYEFMPLFRCDAEGVKACAQVAYSELLMSGVTTLVDMSVAWEGWLEAFAASGLRGVLAPMYRSASWRTDNGHVVTYDWNEQAGAKAMEAALKLIEVASKHSSGRMSGMVSPSQIDTCTPGLIRDSHAEATARRLPFQIHAAQSVVEFHEITRRHGLTPVQWLKSLGVLSDVSIIGHGIFLDHHTSAHWPETDDIGMLVDHGVTVAHCPVVFQRRGIAMQSFGRYVAAGVKMGIGTDTYPHHMLEELRAVCIGSRMMAENVFDLRTSDAFNAATLGGAKALGRDDVGRLAAGAKADIVIVDATHPMMRPLRDPLRSLIYCAAERAVKTVIVNGVVAVDGGKVLTMDYPAAAAALEEAQRRAEPKVKDFDWAKRDHLTISPLAFPMRAP
ncbi:amidohydrolase family protein [Terrarubrum flagellatum]|uniref:amidohydrolase family protein n=1 Tax=Terrirubrum flagellatum TaxID=2895980 RepID=UPI003145438F